ncbi:MAG TPA: hypothetical protein VHW01_23090, partial [Polyangiaceae bacterium]|nr:hypothetical protein [Polyangiaceae bacterium]
LGLWLVPKWILAGFALGLVGAGAVAPLLEPHPVLASASRAAVHVATSKSVPFGAAPAVESSEPEAAAPVSAAAPRAELEAARVAPSANAQAGSSSSATFDAELKLISLAKAELDAHRPTHALAWLAEHATQFPNGVFVTEREALSVLARCEQGPPDITLAKQFAAQHPSSPLVARLMKTCRASTPSSPSSVSSPSSLDMRAPVPSAHASFATLPNGSAPLGEPTNEPSGGTRK